MAVQSGLMQGKRGVILGVANNRSIAWGIAKACKAHGAELALTYQGEALKKRVEPLAAELLGERLDALLQGVALIGQSDGGALRLARLGDTPGNRAVVGHPQDHATLALHQT